MKSENDTDELIEIIYRKELNLLLVSGSAFRNNRLSSVIETSKKHLEKHQRLTATVKLNLVDLQASIQIMDWIKTLNDINEKKSCCIKFHWLVPGNEVQIILLGNRLKEMAQFSFQVAID